MFETNLFYIYDVLGTNGMMWVRYVKLLNKMCYLSTKPYDTKYRYTTRQHFMHLWICHMYNMIA